MPSGVLCGLGRRRRGILRGVAQFAADLRRSKRHRSPPYHPVVRPATVQFPVRSARSGGLPVPGTGSAVTMPEDTHDDPDGTVAPAITGDGAGAARDVVVAGASAG